MTWIKRGRDREGEARRGHGGGIKEMVSTTTCTIQYQSKPQIKYKDAIDTSKKAQARPRRVDHIHGRRRREKEKEEKRTQKDRKYFVRSTITKYSTNKQREIKTHEKKHRVSLNRSLT